MAQRSTRLKIRNRCDRLVHCQEEFATYLYEMSMMSEGRTPALEKAIPALLEMSNMIVVTCKQLRTEL
ncbi:unnamed protein product [marine sediment metagenome]|uniref:Uncharacterized protein n=1 Tax=marine sediment metagenome TaxID=412755 RepID=X1T1B7_9ZZZZ